MTSELHHQHHSQHHNQQPQQHHHHHHIPQNSIPPQQSSSTSATPHLTHRSHHRQAPHQDHQQQEVSAISGGIINNPARETPSSRDRDNHHHPQQQQHHNRHSGNTSNNGTPNLKQQQKQQHQQQQHQQQPHQQQQHHGGGGGGLNNNNNNFVIVELHRDDATCPGFGFNIKGGAEHGCPVYIWRVEGGSLADRSGLKSGDEIVQANGISFGGITHAEALKVLKGQTTLTLCIKAPQQQQQQAPVPHPRRTQPMVPPHSSSSIITATSHAPSSQDQPMIPLPPPLPPPHTSIPSSQQQQLPPNHSLHHRVEYYTWVDRLGNPVPPPTPQDNYPPSRLIPLEICPGQNLGLMIRGGSEYGLGIYVTGVDPGSVAERVGLQRGDEILSVNSKDFTRITHDKAVQILKSSKHMQIVATHIGKIPADLNDGEDLLKLGETWRGLLDDEVVDVIDDVEDDEVVNIINVMEHSASGATTTGQHIDNTVVVDPHHHHHHHHHEEIELGQVDDDDEELEDELRRIVPVSASSSSSSAAAARMNMDDSLDLDFVRCSSSSGGGAPGNKRCTTSILQMIEEKARTVLNKSEHSRFTFYRIEYMQGFLPVVAFVRILLELLNTSEKYTLLTEVRELIRPTDLTQFDELIYTKTAFRVSSNPATSKSTMIIPPPLPPNANANNSNIITSTGAIPQQLSHSPNPPSTFEHVIMPNNNPQSQQVPLPPPLPPPQGFMHHNHPPPHLQDQLMQDEMVVDDFIEEHGVVLDPSGGFGAWRGGGGGVNNGQPIMQQQQGQLPQQQPFVGGTDQDRQLLITHDPAALTISHPQVLNVMNPSVTSAPSTSTTVATRTPNNVIVPAAQHSGVVGPAGKTPQATNKFGGGTTTTTTTDSGGQFVVGTSGGSGGVGGTTSSSVPAVRFKVRITKVKPILGIAIEGGSNTPHRLPRIIDVNPDGSAFHSNLRAGQVLLTVDSKKLDGLTHEEIARLILDCYVDMTKSQIEFLVVEAKQNYYYFNSQQQQQQQNI